MGCLATAFCPLSEAQTPKAVFESVTSKLDPGGSFFLYMNSQRWNQNVIDWLDHFERLAPEEQNDDVQPVAQLGFALVKNALVTSGLLQIDGFGVSSVRVDDSELFRNRVALNRTANIKAGSLWEVIGTESAPLTGLRLMPATTVAAEYGVFDANMLLAWCEQLVNASGIDELQISYQQSIDGLKQQGIDVKQLLASTAAEMGFVLTANPAKLHPYQLGPEVEVNVPDLALAIILKVNDRQIFETLPINSCRCQMFSAAQLRTWKLAVSHCRCHIRLRSSYQLPSLASSW